MLQQNGNKAGDVPAIGAGELIIAPANAFS